MGVAIFGAMLGPVIGCDRLDHEHRGDVRRHRAHRARPRGVGRGDVVAAQAERRSPCRCCSARSTERRMLASVWFVALPSISFGALGVLAPLQLHDLGLSAVAISGVWLVAVGFEATAAPLVGAISDRRGRLWPLRLGAVAAGICFVALHRARRALGHVRGGNRRLQLRARRVLGAVDVARVGRGGRTRPRLRLRLRDHQPRVGAVTGRRQRRRRAPRGRDVRRRRLPRARRAVRRLRLARCGDPASSS